MQVSAVLDEMVYDVETCAHENEVAELRKALEIANASVTERQVRESELIQERQQVKKICHVIQVMIFAYCELLLVRPTTMRPVLRAMERRLHRD